MLWKHTDLIYIDDVIIYSNTMEEHIRCVDEIHKNLSEAGVTLKMNKCTIFSDKLEYLGHIIHPGKLEVDDAHNASPRQPRANFVHSSDCETYTDGFSPTLPESHIRSISYSAK